MKQNGVEAPVYTLCSLSYSLSRLENITFQVAKHNHIPYDLSTKTAH